MAKGKMTPSPPRRVVVRRLTLQMRDLATRSSWLFQIARSCGFHDTRMRCALVRRFLHCSHLESLCLMEVFVTFAFGLEFPEQALDRCEHRRHSGPDILKIDRNEYATRCVGGRNDKEDDVGRRYKKGGKGTHLTCEKYRRMKGLDGREKRKRAKGEQMFGYVVCS